MGPMIYEHRREPLLPRSRYLSRFARHVLGALALLIGTLFLGMADYHGLEGLSWIDACLNASMILGGMGPVHQILTPAGKIFAGTYALFAGLMFLLCIGVILAPVAHRALPRFHLDEKQ